MAVQTTYTNYHGKSYAGMVADGQLVNTVSKLNASGDTIPYGIGVVSDGAEGAELPSSSSTAAEFVGVVKYELNRAYADGETFGAPDGFDMSVVPFGVMYVEILDTVAKDDPVYLRVGSTDTGKFSGIVGTGATLGVLIPNAKFITGGSAGQIVKVSFGLGG